MVSLLQRLKERKLVQWTLAYAAGAWALLQVVDLVGEQFAWPGVLLRSITVLLAFGFMAALILAWYHGEKGQQRVSGTELLMLSALLVIAGVAVAWVPSDAEVGGSEVRDGVVDGSKVRSVASTAERSVAVLPFANLSEDKENEYFSDGITDDILMNLSKIVGLRVTSRTSAMKYKGAQKGIPEIAKELGVGYIVEGSVRRAGERIRVSVQLIDARGDKQLWGESYDRDLRDVFAVQTEIAEKIAGGLQSRLSPQERQQLASRGTEDLNAYDAYLRGRAAFHEFYHNSFTPEAGQRAVSSFKQALKLDPKYALAYAGLAQTYAELRWVSGPALLDSALVAAEKAVSLDPTLAEAHSAYGLAKTYDGQTETAFAAYRRAFQLNPSHAAALHGIAGTHRARGELDEALRWSKRAVAVEPTEIEGYAVAAEMYWLLGDRITAEEWYHRAIALRSWAWPRLGRLRFYAIEGDWKRVDEEAQALRSETDGAGMLWVLGFVELHRGAFAASKRYYEAWLREVKPERPHLEMAYALWKLGERERAEGILIKQEAFARDNIEQSEDFSPRLTLARLQAFRGNAPEAVRWLEEAASLGWRDYRWARVDPYFENVRNDPAFVRLLADVERAVTAMRRRGGSTPL